MYPPGLKYHSEHTWLNQETENRVRIGITFHAQEQMQQVVFVELPEVGSVVIESRPFGTIESRKAVHELFSPVSGFVVDINQQLEIEPDLINSNTYGAGWIMLLKMDEQSQLESLMTADQYQAFIEGE